MTTTTQAPTAAEVTAAPAAFEAAVARMVSDEPTLTDIAVVLHTLGGNHVGFEVDPMRTQALCHLACRALGKYDAWTRSAPPEALRDVVAEALQVCQGPSCDNDVAPWDGSDYCGPYCANEHARAVGEA